MKRIPTWALLGAIVAVSTVIRFVYARRDPAAWIFPDEGVYAELGKALAENGEFELRGNPGTGGLGIVYPLLISPAFWLFDAVRDAHEAVKAINSLLMSLTAVPVYLIARRLVTRNLALVAAVLSVSILSMTYTGTVMTENAFYPVTAVWALLLVRTLERPTIGRQVVLVAAIGFAYLTRAQAVLFGPALVTAVLIVALLDHGRQFWRGLWAYRVTGLALVLGALAVGLRQAVRGERLSDILGAYIALRDYSYGVADVSHWALYHLAELVIMLGVFPFAAFLIVAAVSLRPAAAREHRIFAAVAVSLALWFLVVVSAFANTPVAQRIEERYLFHVAPLFFIALVVWIGSRVPRPWWAVAPAALLTALLPTALPVNNFLNDTAVHDTVSLLPIWRWRDRIFSAESIDEVVIAAAIAGALAVALIPRRYAVLLPVALLLYYGVATRPVEARIRQASHGAWEAGARPDYNWVDDAVGADADVAQVWTGGGNHFSFWESEFYNRSVDPIYALSQPFDAFGQRMARILPDGRVEYLGRPLDLRYALTDIWTKLQGEFVTRNDLTGMAVYRLDGPLVVIESLQGLFPDRWTGASAIYRRYDCERGSLVLDFETNPVLHPKRFSVIVSQHAAETGRLVVPPRPARKVLSVPLRPRDHFCEASFAIPTASATVETPGDLRQLGLRINSVRYVGSR